MLGFGMEVCVVGFLVLQSDTIKLYYNRHLQPLFFITSSNVQDNIHYRFKTPVEEKIRFI